MPDIPDLKWLPLAEASGWFADHLGLKHGRKVLLRALADGSVLARGIRPPDRKFVAIPKGVWSSGQINWRASTVVDFPDVYQSVQVDRLQAGERDELRTIPDPQPATPTPATIARENRQQRRKRRRSVEDDALLRNRIKSVLAVASRRWRDPQKRPELRQMARELARNQGAALGYKSEETLRQILRGSYKPMRRLGIRRLSG